MNLPPACELFNPISNFNLQPVSMCIMENTHIEEKLCQSLLCYKINHTNSLLDRV